MRTFIIQPTSGDKPVEIQADTAEYDSASGATLFKSGTGDSETLVARLLNVSFYEKPAAE